MGRMTWATRACVVMAVLLASFSAQADGVCVVVRLVIPQRMTLERDGFDASLILTNELTDAPLESVVVTLSFKDADGNPAESLFFWQAPSRTGMTVETDGTSTIPAEGVGSMRWLIIPAPSAGGSTPEGRTYRVKASIAYEANAQNFTIDTFEETIYVQPQPELVLDYALPRYVEGDDPFTGDVTEPSVPFELAVRVDNVGAGWARNLRIASLQPRIIENLTGALVDFRLVGTFLNDQTIANTLTIRFGDIAPGACGTGAWAMTTSMKGQMTELSGSFTHREDLGGARTSIVRQPINTHRLFHRVLVDSAGKDEVPDLLVDLGVSNDGVPDVILESDCVSTPVIVVPATSEGAPDANDPSILVTASSAFGWNFVQVLDPAEGMRAIRRVVRQSDVKVLHERNAWLDLDNTETRAVMFVDRPPLGSTQETYRVYFDFSDLDTTPPITTLEIMLPYTGTDPVVVTPYTIMTLSAFDELGRVARTEFRRDGGAWTPANQPFYFNVPGPHLLEFRSVDGMGNEEAIQRVNLLVDPAGPEATVASPADGATYLIGEMLPITFTVTDLDPGATHSARIVPVTGSFEAIVQDGDVVDLTEFAVGSYEFEVRGNDWLGQASRTVVRFIVQRQLGACENVPDGSSCDDRKPCTIDDTCLAGVCTGAPNPCDDTNSCTDDSCEETLGCEHAPNTDLCDDGNACTSSDVCANGACSGVAVTCDDGNACTDNSCEPATGCVYTNNTGACDDANACTENDVCAGGSCVGSTKSCDDSNVCTNDSCNPSSGCAHVANTAPCDDNNSCTTGDTCADSACTGTALPEGSHCDDGLQCTAFDECTAAGQCSGAAVACVGGASCSESTCCGADVEDCDDSDPCTDDACAVDGGCQHAIRAECISDAGALPDAGADVDGGAVADASMPDAFVVADAGRARDASTMDAAANDAAITDAAIPADSGSVDGGVRPDAGRDAGVVRPDASVTVDASVGAPPDAGETNDEPPKGCNCRDSAEPRGDVAALLLLFAWAWRRRRA